MCGIAGFFSEETSLEKNDVIKMTEVLHHRGPDAKGYFYERGIGMGHRRLAVMDLSSAANQPMTSHDGRYVMVFNGEIYNYRDLAVELNVKLKTSGDTEVVLECFAKWGPGFVNRLNGMFSIAIYDKIEAELFLFRDRMGIKPLFYFYDQSSLLFASELKAIRSVKKDLEIDPQSVYSFLHLGYVPQPNTIFRSVFKLPSGSFMRASKTGIAIKQYWSAADHIRGHVITDEKVAQNQLKGLIMDSVDRRLMSDVPIGTFLSGGIDSSLVTAVAQANTSTAVNTFSIGFEESKFNESNYARSVARHLKTNHHEFTVTKQDAMDLVDEMVQTYDEPFVDSSAIPTMLVSKLARAHVTVALSGDGGDELFHGYGAYKWAQRLDSSAVRLLRKPIRSVLERMSSRYQRASTMFQYTDPQRIRSHIFSQEQYLFNETELQKLLIDPGSMTSPLNEDVSHLARKLSPAEHQAYMDFNHYLQDDLLVKVDRASMKYGLEVRVPLLDHRLVEFALNLSPKLKMHHGEMKYLLKQVLYDFVPKQLFDRPKWGFSIPLQHWLKQDLRYLLDQFLSREVIEKHGWVQFEIVDRMKKSFFAGSDYLFNRIWCLIILHKWLEQECEIAV